MARTLGIDIDRSAVRGVVYKTAFRKSEVERYIAIPLTEPVDGPGRLPELHDALQNMLRAIGKPPDSVVTAIDGTQASLRVVELPQAASKRLAEVLPFELESMLPFEISDAVVDYQTIGTKAGTLQLMAAAALRTRVAAHLATFQGTAVDPREVAVGAAALDGLRALCPELAQKPVVLLELCEREANMCVLERGHASFARTLSVGWDGDPKNEAELWQGVHRTLAAYRASGGTPVETLYLCGLGPLTDLAPWLARELSLPVEVLQLPSVQSELVTTPADLPVYARAAALAGRGSTSAKRINLRVGEFASKRAQTELAGYLNLVAICGVAVLLSLVFALKARQHTLEDEQAALRKRLSETTQAVFGKAVTDPSQVESMINSPQNENPLIRFDAYDALAAISAAVPQEISHEVRHLRIDFADEKKEGDIELQGALATIDQRDQIVNKLEEHGCFKEIERGKTSPGRTTDQLNYQIEAKIRCPGEAAVVKKKVSRGDDE
ncbi:MAG TPA: pilus assembly protein PilM [Polyangiales bacterium]|jgi:general secretion pathway protein L|nr:pilus assembly protein PilM [Polyangiales bacterium]